MDQTIESAQEEAVANLLRQRYSDYRVVIRDWTQGQRPAGSPVARRMRTEPDA